MARLSLVFLVLVGVSAGAMAFNYERDDKEAMVGADLPFGEIGEGEMVVKDLSDIPAGMMRGRCKSGECRKKCNAKGENGACAFRWCVCWK